ncbi:regulator of Ty1 Transposition [Coemansia guatemalensis]|uniref:Regulator of Ty1 Transposition n=1 Tax=Coemansia guatemalensis TaxID=2761395 RepID=A0A9W8I410_9FUNG|nr:regulator of Ty1 Transposition [Coemansia guatemalensis]
MGHGPGMYHDGVNRSIRNGAENGKWSEAGISSAEGSLVAASSASTESFGAAEVDPDSSPIAADRIYEAPNGLQQQHTAEEEDSTAAMLYLQDGKDRTEIFGGYALQRGINILRSSTSPVAAAAEEKEGRRVVRLTVAQAVEAEIEIADGLHVVYDYGSQPTVGLGHRRSTLRRGVGYAIGDGKQLWLGGTAFWYHVTAAHWSPSPSPPWQRAESDAQVSPCAAPRYALHQLREEAFSEPDMSPRAPLRYQSHKEPLAEVKLSPQIARPSPLRREAAEAGSNQQQRARASRLRREVAGLGISQSPPAPDSWPDQQQLQQPVAAASPDGSFGLSPVLAQSPPRYASSSEASVAVDTQLMSPFSPHMLVAASPTPPPLAPADGLPDNSDMRVEESPRSSRPPTRPVSPSRQPASPAAPDDSPMAAQDPQLPLPGDFVYAPPRIILFGGASPATGNPASQTGAAQEHRKEEDASAPRFPYDSDRMEAFLHSATQATLPTQLDEATADRSGSSLCAQGTVSTAMSSDFSQTFLAPPPPPSTARPRAVATAVNNLSKKTLRDSTPESPVARSDGSCDSRELPRLPSKPPASVVRPGISTAPGSGSTRLRRTPLALQPSSSSNESSPQHTTAFPTANTPRPGSRTARPSMVSSTARARGATAPLASDGFPDDLLVLSTQSAARALHQRRRHTQAPPLALPALFPAAGSRTPLSASATLGSARRRASASPDVVTPSKRYHSATADPLPSRDCTEARSLFPDDGLPSDEEPALPQPSFLLQSRSAEHISAPRLEEQQQQQSRKITSSEDCAEDLFNPLVDPLSSLPSSVNDSQSPDQVSPVTEAPQPAMPQRAKAVSEPAAAPKSEPAGPAAAAASAGSGWINMDEVRKSPKRPLPATRARARAKTSRGNAAAAGSANGNGSGKSLRESLRKLNGNRGLGRTGLSSRRASAARKKQSAKKPVKQIPSSSSSSPPPADLPTRPLAKRALTGPTASDTCGSPAQKPRPPATRSAPGSSATLAPKLDSPAAVPSSRRRGPASHRNLQLSGCDSSTPRLTRRRSGQLSAPSPATVEVSPATTAAALMATLSGFPVAERERQVRLLEAGGFHVTEDPLCANVCIRHGRRLGRTLKVLCALARGTPIVTTAFIQALSSDGPLTDPLQSAGSGTADELILELATPHLLCDRATEREWGMSLADTLQRARELGRPDQSPLLLAAFCVYIAEDVARPDPISLAVMVRAAGGFVVNDYGRREHLLRAGHAPSELLVPQRQRDACSESPAPPTEPQSAPPLMPAKEVAAPQLMDCLPGELTESSSTEPDNDSDEDWSLEQSIRDAASRRSSANGRRRKRKTLPKLKPLHHLPSDLDIAAEQDTAANGDCHPSPLPPPSSVSPAIDSEPSVILAPPTAPTTPKTNAPAASVSPQFLQKSKFQKRRRVEPSPTIAGTMMHPDMSPNPSRAGLLNPCDDPEKLQQALAARKAELGDAAEHTELLVLSANPHLDSKRAWETHGVKVVDPEKLIQSIIHCSILF